ncbi:MAG: hypothetical protein H8E31_11280, partial [Planctomycetes bacterium]|nr:hypothetical protein [Planctomycetota bacterium]
MALLLLLAVLVAPQGSRAPVPARQLDCETLLERIGERRLPREERMAYLEELAVRGQALEFDAVHRIRGSVRGEFLVDYVRCLSLCGSEALPELRKLLKRHDPAVTAEAVYAVTRLDAPGGGSHGQQGLAHPRAPGRARVAAPRRPRARRSG